MDQKRRIAAPAAACLFVAVLFDHHPYLDGPIGLVCVVFLVAVAVDYLTKGRRTQGGALDRNAWMPSSWRKTLFGSAGKSESDAAQ